MKKIVAFGLLALTLCVFIISSVDDLTKVFAQAKYKSQAWWGSDKYQYGDLYGFCYLPHFRIKNVEGVSHLTRFDTTASETKKIDLYALSDSYTWGILQYPSLFHDVNKITFTKLNYRQVTSVSLDKTKKNVLLLECSERNLRILYEDTAYLKHFFDVNATVSTNTDAGSEKQADRIRLKFKLNDIDPNIEFNIWDYRFLTPFKEFKAQLYYSLFNRVSKGAYVSEDNKYLLLGETIDTVYKQSAFKPIGKTELNEIIRGINNTYDLYKSKGFDEVYMAIIPNPVSILYPHFHNYTYNRLVSLVQNNKALKCKIIDANAPFKQSKEQIYRYSDSHWNNNGERIWLSLVNNALANVEN